MLLLLLIKTVCDAEAEADVAGDCTTCAAACTAETMQQKKARGQVGPPRLDGGQWAGAHRTTYHHARLTALAAA